MRRSDDDFGSWSCQHARVEINCWRGTGDKTTVRAPNQPVATMTQLRAAIADARAPESTGSGVLWRLERGFSAGQRAAARAVVGLGSVALVSLAMTAFVVTGRARDYVAAALCGVGLVVGLVTIVAFHYDVGLTVTDDGRLRREGWGGAAEFDLRQFRRVTVKAGRTGDDGVWMELGGD